MSVTVFVPALAEFGQLVEAARSAPGCAVRDPQNGYWRIEAERELMFERKPLKLGPALWNSALAGGFRGKIVEYGRDRLQIVSEG